MYPESDYLLLSGLQHLRFCPRQCALIHIEQLWKENFFTASGRVLHEKVHGGAGESRNHIRTERGLKIFSRKLGLIGQTHGEPKPDTSDEVQLCAQAICLEEMLGCSVSEGALFYFKIRRRITVPITAELRKETEELAFKFHDLVESGLTPKAEYKKKCESCSFIDVCFPESAGRNKSVNIYLKRRLNEEEEISPAL